MADDRAGAVADDDRVVPLLDAGCRSADHPSDREDEVLDRAPGRRPLAGSRWRPHPLAWASTTTLGFVTLPMFSTPTSIWKTPFTSGARVTEWRRRTLIWTPVSGSVGGGSDNAVPAAAEPSVARRDGRTRDREYPARQWRAVS